MGSDKKPLKELEIKCPDWLVSLILPILPKRLKDLLEQPPPFPVTYYKGDNLSVVIESEEKSHGE
jgi:hypothetical protein